VKEVFLVAYGAGPIRPVSRADDDPGRVRIEAVLGATYGPSPAAHQVRARFLGMPVRVHRRIVPALARVAARLEQARRADPRLARYLRRLSGGFAGGRGSPLRRSWLGPPRLAGS
jgi:hypothetical protein